MVTIILFFCFGLIFPLGRWGDVMLSIRSMYVYTPVFATALTMLATGAMDPATCPVFKASSEAYGGGFPAIAWLNVSFVALAWALLAADVAVAVRDSAHAGMVFSSACLLEHTAHPRFTAA